MKDLSNVSSLLYYEFTLETHTQTIQNNFDFFFSVLIFNTEIQAKLKKNADGWIFFFFFSLNLNKQVK